MRCTNLTFYYSATQYEIEKPDQRHKSLVRANTDIHPGTASTKASWDFLEHPEDEPRDTAVMCGDFNAR